MAQALLLMGIYTFLPLAIFLSGYDLRALFLGSVALFTVKMFASMWVIAQWMDAKLVASMYPTGTINNVARTASLFYRNIFTIIDVPRYAIDAYKAAILDTLLVLLLIGLPMLWVSMMGWLGINLNAAIKSIMSAAEDNAKQSAQTSAAVVKYVANTAIKKSMKKGP